MCPVLHKCSGEKRCLPVHIERDIDVTEILTKAVTPLKCGHPPNQDTLIGPKGVHTGVLNYIKDWVHVVQTRNLHRFAYNRYLRVTVRVD